MDSILIYVCVKCINKVCIYRNIEQDILRYFKHWSLYCRELKIWPQLWFIMFILLSDWQKIKLCYIFDVMNLFEKFKKGPHAKAENWTEFVRLQPRSVMQQRVFAWLWTLLMDKEWQQIEGFKRFKCTIRRRLTQAHDSWLNLHVGFVSRPKPLKVIGPSWWHRVRLKPRHHNQTTVSETSGVALPSAKLGRCGAPVWHYFRRSVREIVCPTAPLVRATRATARI